jgi:hypothetical protein
VELERFSFVLLPRPEDAPDHPPTRLDLLLAGPFGDRTDESLRGLCILDLGLDETRELMAEDSPGSGRAHDSGRDVVVDAAG